ncbi:unnamed protein product, partial [Dovyalis caffra]
VLDFWSWRPLLSPSTNGSLKLNRPSVRTTEFTSMCRLLICRRIGHGALKCPNHFNHSYNTDDLLDNFYAVFISETLDVNNDITPPFVISTTTLLNVTSTITLYNQPSSNLLPINPYSSPHHDSSSDTTGSSPY